ncbi:MAG: aminotransferase class I/II-fold pyridoxal phosphate-dependent enzyme [Telluria sp.]
MHISSRMDNLTPLATTAVHGQVEAMRVAGEDVIDFSIAISHFPAPHAVRSTVAQMALTTRIAYTSVGGAHEVKQQLVAKLQRENRLDADTEEIILTNGAKQGLYEALSVLTAPGDTIIVLRPYWPAYLATAALLRLQVALADLPGQITAGFLATLPAARCLVLNNPHNPSGKVFTDDELRLLADWMRTNDCRAIVDESYEKLIFEGSHHSLAAMADWRALGIVTLFSASQGYAMMGWRAGFAVAPRSVIAAMEVLQGPITAAPSALTQATIGAAFAQGDASELLDDYRVRRDLVCDMLDSAAWLAVQRPDSGPYLWLDVRKLHYDTAAFAEQLLNRYHVAIMPGEALGCPGWVRIGYISDAIDTLRRGVALLLRFGDDVYGARCALHGPA